jgi:hypothetical protein
MGGNEAVGNTEETFGNDAGHLETVEVLVAYLCQDSSQCVVDLLRSESSQEHYLYFRRDEEEGPSGSVDLAVEGEAIEGFHDSPVSRVGIAFERKNRGNGGLLLDENRTNMSERWHKFRHRFFGKSYPVSFNLLRKTVQNGSLW